MDPLLDLLRMPGVILIVMGWSLLVLASGLAWRAGVWAAARASALPESAPEQGRRGGLLREIADGQLALAAELAKRTERLAIISAASLKMLRADHARISALSKDSATTARDTVDLVDKALAGKDAQTLRALLLAAEESTQQRLVQEAVISSLSGRLGELAQALTLQLEQARVPDTGLVPSLRRLQHELATLRLVTRDVAGEDAASALTRSATHDRPGQ